MFPDIALKHVAQNNVCVDPGFYITLHVSFHTDVLEFVHNMTGQHYDQILTIYDIKLQIDLLDGQY